MKTKTNAVPGTAVLRTTALFDNDQEYSTRLKFEGKIRLATDHGGDCAYCMGSAAQFKLRIWHTVYKLTVPCVLHHLLVSAITEGFL